MCLWRLGARPILSRRKNASGITVGVPGGGGGRKGRRRWNSWHLWSIPKPTFVRTCLGPFHWKKSLKPAIMKESMLSLKTLLCFDTFRYHHANYFFPPSTVRTDVIRTEYSLKPGYKIPVPEKDAIFSQLCTLQWRYRGRWPIGGIRKIRCHEIARRGNEYFVRP